MNVGPRLAYFNSIVQVCDEDATVWGAGVIVDDGHVVTCAHVVAYALGLDADVDEEALPANACVGVRRPFVDGADAEPLPCQVRAFHARAANSTTADIALLSLSRGTFPVLDDFPIARFAGGPVSEGARVRTFGFPEDADGTVDCTVPATYRIVEAMPNGWYHSHSDEAHGEEIRSGFSGAPVMDADSGGLIGIVCEADSARRTARIAPTSAITSVHPIEIARVSPVSRASGTGHTASPPPLTAPRARWFLDRLLPGLHRFLTVRLQVLPDPAERAVLEDYLSDRRAALWHELSHKTYLPPPTKEVPTAPAQLPAGSGAFFSPVQQLIKEVAGLAGGGDAASAQISALSKRSRRVRNLLERLRRSSAPLVVLGEPGSGKSLTLKEVALGLCDEHARRVFPSLCIFIPLGRWQPTQSPSPESVERLVLEHVPPGLHHALDALASQQRLVVIFDGMDEMSRERYTEHTAALSEYAKKYEGRIQTLFSCRVTDFSPAFEHHRLVLMPFGRRQMKQYLARQLGEGPFRISDEQLSLRQLVRRLDERKLPIQPNNPFSLWLLSLYLREREQWPETRAGLLEFLYEYQFERKRAEASSGVAPTLSRSVLFEQWARLAYQITQRNRGTDIEVHEVRGLFGAETHTVIETGRVCGVLQQSLESDPPSVRFEHHRAQEFFTALHIVRSDAPLDWAQLLDAPRWQETLVNVVQMEEARAPMKVLGDGLRAVEQTVGDDGGAAPKAPVERARREAEAAERLGLSARVLRALAPSSERTALAQLIGRTAIWLGQNGNPTTQVKVLRLAGESADLDLRPAVDRALRSGVAWVRQQAHEVVAQLSGGASATPLPEEIAASLGEGKSLRELPGRLRTAARLKSPGLALVSAAAACLLIAHLALLSALAPAVASGVAETVATWPSKFLSVRATKTKGELARNALAALPDARNAARVFQLWVPRLVLAAGVITLVVVLFVPFEAFWVAIPGVGFGVLVVAILVHTLWSLAPVLPLLESLSLMVGLAFWTVLSAGVASFLLFVTSVLVCLATSSALGLVNAWWTRSLEKLRATTRATWAAGGYGEFAEELGGMWGGIFVLLCFVAGLGFIKSDGGQELLAALLALFPSLPYASPALSAGVVALLLVAGVVGLVALMGKLGVGPARDDPADSAALMFGPAFLAGVVYFIGTVGVYVYTNHVPDLPLVPRPLDALISALLVGAVIGLLVGIPGVLRGRYAESLGAPAGFVAAAGFVYAISMTAFYLVDLVVRLLDGLHASWLLRGVVVVLGVTIVTALLIGVGFLCRGLWRFARVALQIRRLSRTPPTAVNMQIASASPQEQARYLRELDPRALSLTTDKFYEFLIEMQDSIKGEPARSVYFMKRAEIEDVMRQEQRG